jgi:hypothetical protein
MPKYSFASTSQLVKILFREVSDRPNRSGSGDLNLERAPTEFQFERFLDEALHLGFENDVMSGEGGMSAAGRKTVLVVFWSVDR